MKTPKMCQICFKEWEQVGKDCEYYVDETHCKAYNEKEIKATDCLGRPLDLSKPHVGFV